MEKSVHIVVPVKLVRPSVNNTGTLIHDKVTWLHQDGPNTFIRSLYEKGPWILDFLVNLQYVAYDVRADPTNVIRK